MKQSFLISILIALLILNCSNPSETISNPQLTVTYNRISNTLEATSQLTNHEVLKNILPKGATSNVQKQPVNDDRFGAGNALYIETNDGGHFLFTLYQSQPFLFVTQTVHNNSSDTLDIKKLNPLTFSINLNKPTSALKTLGTGGLLDPDKNPGSYVFLTTVDPQTRHGVVTGWLTNEKGSGVVFSDVKKDTIVITPQIDYGHYRLLPQKKEATETLLIGYFDDARLGEEQFADAIATKQAIKMRDRSAVYCTWYDEKHGGAGSERSTIELAKYIQKNLKDYGLGVIQIDDQWQAGGSYNGPARGFDRARKVALPGDVINGTSKKGFPANYPDGMEKTAQGIHDAGLMAGIWWMPFARNHQDPEYANRQDWFAYRANGKPYETAWGGTSLDLTNPEVKKHVATLAKTMQNWGFNYFKMDGLWTGTVTEQVYINDGYVNDSIGNNKPLHDPLITQIEAFRDGLKLIRNATQNKVFLSGCAISQNMRSFGASIGLVDAMRIGPDFNHDGESIRTGAIRASRLYFLNGRVWWNDPDPSMLRESGASTADPAAKGIGSLTRARLLPSYVAISNQFFLSSDWIPDLPKERIDILKRCMLSHDGTARPVDAFDSNLPTIWRAQKKVAGVERNVIGLFNWALENRTISCDLGWAGLRQDTNYYAFDFWNNKPLKPVKKVFSLPLQPESCRIIALRAQSNHPVVVSTSQHVTQGMIDIKDETWHNDTLSGTSRLVANDPYELRIAGLHDGAHWTLKKAALSENSHAASIKVLPEKEKGWLRVVITSKTTRIIKWQLKFNSEKI